MRTAVLAALCLAVTSAASLAATPPGLLGANVELDVYSPSMVKADLLGSGTATIGAQTEFPHIGQAPFLKQGSIVNASVNLTNKVVIIRYPASAEGDTFAVATFNGYVLKILTAAAPAIKSVKVLSETNVSGLDATRITTAPKKIEINLNGLSLPAATQGTIELGLTF